MEELRNFFNNPSPSAAQTIKIRAPFTGGHRITKNDSINDFNRREEHRRAVVLSGTDYAREVKEKENAMYLKYEELKQQQQQNNQSDKSQSNQGLNTMEELSSQATSSQNIENLYLEETMKGYNLYSYKKREDIQNLDIEPFLNNIVERSKAFSVLIIEGPTGCGKTTQVPQKILDDAYTNRKPCNIVVTQPRRIAAMSIAKRVAHERGWDIGGIVGYQVGLEKKTSNDTKISYVTTGVLLQKLVSAKNMNEYTHVILDEVHERSQDMDFLLLVVKKLLFTVSPNVKVILMSATIYTKVFLDYFSIPSELGSRTSAVVTISNDKQRFSNKIFYLTHLEKLVTVPQIQAKVHLEPTILPEAYRLAVELINAIERIDIEEEYPGEDISTAELPAVLIFLPGIYEIEQMYTYLNDTKLRQELSLKIKDDDITRMDTSKFKWWVLPLHSTITADEQVKVFQKAGPGLRKIILATNIAESSITVPDIKYVIDYCLTKVLEADPETNFTSLKLKWAAKTNCEQRAGRAGRVRDGRVFRIIREKVYEELPQECEPEIMRCPLERLVLLAKMLDMGPPSDVLALAMDPPEMSNIHRTILVLKEIGALMKTVDDEWSHTDGNITYLGRIMAKLPIDVRCSKLIVLGHIFGCLEECIIMAAGMSVKDIFSNPFGERLNAYNSKLTWADGSTSDAIAILNIYKVWNHLRQQKYFRQQGNNEVHWARRFYVQLRPLKELDDLVREIKMRCSREGIEPLSGKSPWSKHEIPLVLKVILAGAFYPQYFIQATIDEVRERDAMRILGGLDPRNTVYLKGFPEDQPGIVYTSVLKNIIKKQIGDEPRVTFDKNSQKVYLTFQEKDYSKNDDNSGNPSIPGQVALPVYKAIKARHLNMNIRLPLLSVEEAEKVAAAIESLNQTKDINMMVPRLPAIDDTYFRLKISQFNNVGKFWVQYDEESNTNELNQIQATLNRKSLLACTCSIALDMLVAAPYDDGANTNLYRARVVKLLPGNNMVELHYIDFGSYGRVGKGSLRELPAGVCRETPPLAMQCRLAGVAPAPLLNAHAQWSPAATTYFGSLIEKGRLMGQIYSVTHGIVAIELLVAEGKINVNKELLNNKYAVPCEESYDSKLNHDVRQTASELNMAQRRAYNKDQAQIAFNELVDVATPGSVKYVSDVYLKGPTSPLESRLHNMMYASRDKSVQVEWNSVNGVLLDTEPQEVYERLLVAAEVGQNQTSSKLTLRHTTLLPNIRGLPAIIALLFCPEAELRRNKECTRYVSVLCGLGSDESGAPYFPEHDLLVNIDADLTVDDLGSINHIRYLMDFTMSGSEDGTPTTDNDIRATVPKTIRQDLMRLLEQHRKHREPEVVVNAWEWKSVPQEDLLEINSPAMLSLSVVFPMHSPLELYAVCREKLLELKRDVDELKGIVTRSYTSSMDKLECKLCGTPAMPLHAMRIHLCSNSHMEKEDDFRNVQS